MYIPLYQGVPVNSSNLPAILVFYLNGIFKTKECSKWESTTYRLFYRLLYV